MTPGITAGSVTVKKVCTGGAPQFAAAFSRSGSSALTLPATAQIMKGRLMTQQAMPTGQSWPSTPASPKTSIRPMPEPISGMVKGSSR